MKQCCNAAARTGTLGRIKSHPWSHCISPGRQAQLWAQAMDLRRESKTRATGVLGHKQRHEHTQRRGPLAAQRQPPRTAQRAVFAKAFNLHCGCFWLRTLLSRVRIPVQANQGMGERGVGTVPSAHLPHFGMRHIINFNGMTLSLVRERRAESGR